MNRKQRHQEAMRTCVPASVLKARLRDAGPWLLGLKWFRRSMRRKKNRIPVVMLDEPMTFSQIEVHNFAWTPPSPKEI